jgi:hypothetical protein
MAVAAYRNGDSGLNECGRVYGFPKAAVRRLTMKKTLYANGVNATFFVAMEEIQADHIVTC